MWNLLDEVQSKRYKSKSFIQKCSQVQCISWLSEAQGVLSRLRMNFLWLISFIYWWSIIIWLVVSTPLKHISQIGSSSPIFGVKIKNLWSHHLVILWKCILPFLQIHFILQAARAMALRDRFPASWTGSCISEIRETKDTRLLEALRQVYIYTNHMMYMMYMCFWKKLVHMDVDKE